MRPLTGCGWTGTVIGPRRTSSTSVPQIAAASIRITTSVVAGRRDRDLVEPDVTAGRAIGRPSCRVPADLGVQDKRLFDQLVGDPSVERIERQPGRRRPAPAKIPWRTARSFRNWLEMSMC